jgi:UDP-N-acetylmuramoylalanine--D-glutamate ligase
VVVGLARSGIGAARLLEAEGYEVTVTDLKTEEELSAQVAELAPGVELALGGHPEDVFRDAALVVVSPGVPLSIPPLEGPRRAGTEIIGELEFAYRHMQALPFYAVTGTNGKSTTATLLHHMMQAAGRESLLAGNIGNPLSGEISVTEGGGVSIPRVDCAVVEVSSFQLESIRSFRPWTARLSRCRASSLRASGASGRGEPWSSTSPPTISTGTRPWRSTGWRRSGWR